MLTPEEIISWLKVDVRMGVTRTLIRPSLLLDAFLYAFERGRRQGREEVANKIALDVQPELGESPRAYRHRMQIQTTLAQAIRALKEIQEAGGE